MCSNSVRNETDSIKSNVNTGHRGIIEVFLQWNQNEKQNSKLAKLTCIYFSLTWVKFLVWGNCKGGKKCCVEYLSNISNISTIGALSQVTHYFTYWELNFLTLICSTAVPGGWASVILLNSLPLVRSHIVICPRAKPLRSRVQSLLKLREDTAPYWAPTAVLPRHHFNICFGSMNRISIKRTLRVVRKRQPHIASLKLRRCFPIVSP